MKTNKESFGKFDFVGTVGIFGGISAILVVASLMYLAIGGLNYGIDFKGGTEVQVKFEGEVTADTLRTALGDLNVGDIAIQSFSEGHEFVIRFQGQAGANDKETTDLLNTAITSLRSSIETKLADAKPEIRRVDTVGPQVGAELKRNGYLAVFYCLLVILLYVALRFDYKYAPGAVICLFHDAVVTLAVFVLVGKEVNVSILAAIMTLIGFSLNDTIVVFDRIRETEGTHSREGLRFIINKAINDMLSRTIITSGTTFVSALCLWIFADGTVADIAFVTWVGVLFGTYSSVYVAAPVALLMEKLMKKKATA